MTGGWATCACLRRESLREPDAANPHVRFDEGRGSRASASLTLLLYRHPRDFRKGSKANAALVGALEEPLRVLRNAPHNRTGQHNIKKLAGLKPGEGQWRIRWRDYRLRYDIFGEEVILHSFRHRREAY